MKKTYIFPTVEIVDAETTQMLAASVLQIFDGEYSDETLLAPEMNVEDIVLDL